MKAALYVRVSADHQDTANQMPSLTAFAERRGWQITKTYTDKASGMKGREQRPGLDQMLKDASRRKFDVVLVWAMDRLGRNAVEVIQNSQQLEACGVALYIENFANGGAVDTTTPMGKFFFLMMAGWAEYERGQMLERQRAGIQRAKKEGVHFGRPKIEHAVEKKIRAALAKKEKGILKIASECSVGVSVVQRIKAEMVGMAG